MQEELSIRRVGNEISHPLSRSLAQALEQALALDSRLPESVLTLPGMSGRKYRRMVNNLIRNLSNARYLEIGSWLGSTACSAMYGNTVKVTCIDNWSEFGGPMDGFLANTANNRSDTVDFSFIESDFRAVDYSSLGKYNVYLFDGPHTYQDQYDGVRIVQNALDNDYILIVDDYNWPDVRNATQAALTDEKAKVLFGYEIRTTQDDSHPLKAAMESSEWHNGYFVAAISKRKSG